MSEEAWEDLNSFRMSREDAYGVIGRALGCTVCWTRRDGHPLAVHVYHALIDGEIYVTTTENRPKTTAWKRDPRTALVVSQPGTGCVTVVGRVELSDDRAFQRRFLEALCDKMALKGAARAAWIAHMDSDGRLTARIVVEKLITFDERKISF
jgi:nitroimidazol reductase NimA-like FMN-containing flavoprotein (pyridoxamine 5'-phosphate oxidase superfamily)